MQVVITKQSETEYAKSATFTCGRTSAYVSCNRFGQWNVCVDNASHRVWKSVGKVFPSYDAALAAYRSGEMKAILALACEVLT